MEMTDYKPGDEKKILELFHRTYGKPMLERYWRWRFLDNPEKKVMIKLMWDGDQLAGHYAVSPVTLNVDGDSFLTALSMTTMTHPDYTGRGIFKDLAEALYHDEAKNNGLKAVWGFPNNNSHYGFIKNLKWNNLDLIPLFNVSAEKIKTVDHIGISVAKEFNTKHVKAHQSLTSQYKVRVAKSVDYLSWRYLKNTASECVVFETEHNEITYFAVTKIFGSNDEFEIDVLELSFPPDLAILTSLFSAIKDHYKNYHVTKMNTWMPLNDSRHILLEKIGFANSSPVTYSGIRILSEGMDQLNEGAGWFYSMGDSDVY